MSGSVASQVGLVAALERYERGERLAQWFPQVRCLGEEADRRHSAMFEIAMACGFTPAQPGSPTALDWCRKRAAVIRRVFPNHVQEGGR